MSPEEAAGGKLCRYTEIFLLCYTETTVWLLVQTTVGGIFLFPKIRKNYYQYIDILDNRYIIKIKMHYNRNRR